ncbi:MAG: hypothetical protein ABI364_05785 [Caldimonas sp.]
MAVLLTASTARADGAACDAVFAAMGKMAGTPNHQFITTTRGGGKTTQGEVVTVGNKRGVFAAGHWHSRPYDAATESRDLLAARTGKEACTRVRSEAVNGEAAMLFSVHNPTEDGTSDSQTWVSTSRGLPLRQVIDISEGKTHIEVRVDYTHVTAPPAS